MRYFLKLRQARWKESSCLAMNVDAPVERWRMKGPSKFDSESLSVCKKAEITLYSTS
jgi:hypothetical protein